MRCRVDRDYLATVSAIKASIPNLTTMCVGPVHSKLAHLFQPMDSSDGLNSRGGNLRDVGEPFYRPGSLYCTACPALRHNVVLPDGKVVLCCMDYGLRHPLGYLTTMPYEKLFESYEYADVKHRMASHDEDVICRSCYASAEALMA
jgi:hypothetical protein